MSENPTAGADILSHRVAAVRRFNRFYTRQIGVLGERILDSPLSLAQVRVLYELAHRGAPTATDLARDLGLDPGYLSRILGGFRQHSLVNVRDSPDDGRARLLRLTTKGRRTFAALDARSSAEVATALERLSAAEQKRLLDAMHAIEGLLGAHEPPRVPYVLRPHQPGDMGWVVHRHGALYAQEYGYDEQFEALVASIVAEFIQKLEPQRERCWIAEREGEIVGSVFLVQKSDEVAKLRLLLVEPMARGLGIGRRLVDECVRFARSRGYRTLTLWTQSELLAARRIYERAGFRLVAEEPHRSFGKDLVAETWELPLANSKSSIL